MKTTRVLVTMAVLLIGIYAPPAEATIIRVPSNQPTVQAGINASLNGDTVLIMSGTYSENVSFGGKRILVGSMFVLTGDTSYIPQTVIHGSYTTNTVTFANSEDSTTSLIGITITGGSTRGIYCSNSSPSLRNLIVTDNVGGISCLNSSPTIASSTIMNNPAPYPGGGLYCSNSSPTLTNAVIMNNRGTFGGGVYCGDSSAPSIENTLIANNTSVWYGGGIASNRSNPTLKNVIITQNTASLWYGGGIDFDHSNPLLKKVLITMNTVGRPVGVNSGGGGISFRNSNSHLSHVTIALNSAEGGGGGVYVGDYYSTITFDTLDRCNIYSNDAAVGRDIYYYPGPYAIMLHVVVDTFTVMSPTTEHAVRIEYFTFDILHSIRTTSVTYGGTTVKQQTLLNNYPNPFNSQTNISFSIPIKSVVSLEIFDVVGRKLDTIFNEELAAGYYSKGWDAGQCPSGVLFCRFRAGSVVQTKKLILLK